MLEQQHNPNLCELMVGYLTGDCTDAERESFERHLKDCQACQVELEELREVWDSMPGHSEELEVPADLKGEVLRGIFGKEAAEETPDSNSAHAGKDRKWSVGEPKRPTARRLLFSGVVAAAVLGLVVTGALAWRDGVLPSAGKAVKLAEPAEVVRTIALKPADPAQPNCSGTVWVTRRAESEEMVVHLQGLQPNQGTEAYQVWLIHKGVRHNGGTLVVDEKGNGVLTYAVRKDDPPFETIGVTLEPDAKGTQPRGRKVLGS